MPSHRRNNTLPAATVVLIGIGLGVFGGLRASQPFTKTSGVIIQSTGSAFKTSVWLTIVYRYRVGAQEFSGREVVRNTFASGAPYQAGRELPVFFVTSAPYRSYGYGRPMAAPWVLGGTAIVFIGGIILFFAWNA